MPNDFKQFRPEPIQPPTLEDSLNLQGDAIVLSKGTLESPGFSRGQKGWRINSDGLAEFLDVNLGSRFIVASQDQGGAGINGIISSVNGAGGGTAFLKAGTFNTTKDISGLSTVVLQGQKESTTIIDFGSNDATLSYEGTDVYTTGTITSIANGVNVTGSGTSWLANVTTDHQFFIAGTWYKIAAVTSNTTLVLAEGYNGGATFPGASYRIAKPVTDIDLEELTFQNSTGTALYFKDCRNIILSNLSFNSNNKHIVFDNCSEITWVNTVGALSTSNGFEYNNSSLLNAESVLSVSSGAHGHVLNGLRLFQFKYSGGVSGTGDGFNITDSSEGDILPLAKSNGGQGVEFVSGNSEINIISPSIKSNTGDGIKLTATSDDIKISGGNIKGNGAYGVNIAASSCDNTIISLNSFSGNSTAAANDSGTGTLIRSNIGLADN